MGERGCGGGGGEKEDRNQVAALSALKQRLTLIRPLRPVCEQTYFPYELMWKWPTFLHVIYYFCCRFIDF